MRSHANRQTHPAVCLLCLLGLLLLVPLALVNAGAQDTVTGAFEGTVTNSVTGERVGGARVRITNGVTGVTLVRRTDERGRFYQGLLPPAVYKINVAATNYKPFEKEQLLYTTGPNQVVPVPVALEPESLTPAPAASSPGGGASGTANPTVPPPATPAPTPVTATPAGIAPATSAAQGRDVTAETNLTDASLGGAFPEREVETLPLGATTIVRSFDELALLLPGVALPPQTLGSVAGPGVGPGVGTAGQFAVNGLRSRANNFTVDGSDNNDEDIGVRRQGFLALVPQPIESVKEFQVITLLAPAQFGRNIGAQVNAVSKSGGSEHHGALYGFFNSSQLNARNFFDTTNGNAITPLRAGDQNVVVASGFDFDSGAPVNPRPLTVLNQSGGEDSFTFGQAGGVLGGPILKDRLFYFVSTEGYRSNATKEESFAVPTVEQRGAFGTAATGTFVDPLDGGPALAFPTSAQGDEVFSLFPFPNNPNGVYGPNTFTQTLPAGARGVVFSGKVDANFKVRERAQSFTARYNFTDDRRDIPKTGGAIFSTLRPRVRTQNLSTFLNSEMSEPNSASPVFNQVRLSYGRTRLVFDERRDTTFVLPSRLLPNEPFLLNAPVLSNFTLPDAEGVPNSGDVIFISTPGSDVESSLGPLGQVSIAGFSPVGVDVFNFPQRRVNNTYQFADILSLRRGEHTFAFGADIRRTELNSDLPRNSRPLLVFNGAPLLDFVEGVGGQPDRFVLDGFVDALDLAAASAPSGFFQTLATGDSGINLRYYQLNFFVQDDWRVRPNLSISAGLRYEYNTPPREVNERIESTFSSPDLDLVPGLSDFIDGRTKIFDSDRMNFAPRLGVAYSPNLFGRDHPTVIRAGGGIFYDQVLGAVVSQSRNVFPTFLTVNTAGSGLNDDALFEIVNPYFIFAQPGTLDRLGIDLDDAVGLTRFLNNSQFFDAPTPVSGFGITLPARRLQTPEAYHYAVTFEQQIGSQMVASASYVGTQGRRLLRVTTPNLGPNAFLLPLDFRVDNFVPEFFGIVVAPGTRLTPDGFLAGGRPQPEVGAVNIYETSANSRYDALQLQVRGRLLKTFQYNVGYTFSKASDDVSDVFDLAGASALPQNSFDLAAERGPANFDARHRFTYHFIYDLPDFRGGSRALRALFGGTTIAGTGQFQTGQPFTVNSIFDVNLDGNLTDRLNTTSGLVRTGDRRQPLRLTANSSTLLAPVGQDGSVGRNTFRAGSHLLLNLAVAKRFALGERQALSFRAEIFNLTNRANFGVPVRFLEAPGFGQATDTVTPGRRVQFSLKYSF